MAKQAKRERQRLNREARRQAELAATRRRKQMRMARNVAILAVPLLVLFVILQLRSSGGSEPDRTFSKPPAPNSAIKPGIVYSATLDTSEGKITMALDATNAPNSVNNFVFLARKRFYDGLTFHRVARNFVIQGGDPKGDGSGGPGYETQVETPANGYQVGSVAWAKGGQDPPGSAASQFFIVTSPAPAPGQGVDALNQQPYQYGIIGAVTDARSLEVAQRIGALARPTDDPARQRPTKKVTINKVTITESAEPTLPTDAPPAPPSP